MEILVLVTFQNHFYRWGDTIYRQTKGAPIGLRAAQSLARVVMDFWLKEARKRLKEGGMKMLLMDKYVDDVLAVMETLRLGSRWVERRWSTCLSGKKSTGS